MQIFCGFCRYQKIKFETRSYIWNRLRLSSDGTCVLFEYDMTKPWTKSLQIGTIACHLSNYQLYFPACHLKDKYIFQKKSYKHTHVFERSKKINSYQNFPRKLRKWLVWPRRLIVLAKKLLTYLNYSTHSLIKRSTVIKKSDKSLKLSMNFSKAFNSP